MGLLAYKIFINDGNEPNYLPAMAAPNAFIRYVVTFKIEFVIPP